MIAVKAYYNGRAFIPLERRSFLKNQQAVIVIDDSELPVSNKTCRGIAAKYANPALIEKESQAISEAFSSEVLWL